MTTTSPVAQMSGLRKAAVMVLQLSKEDTARILAQLRESEVEELMAEIAQIGSVDAEAAHGVLNEFHTMATARRYAHQGGLDYARDLLEASMGAEKAAEIISTSFSDMLARTCAECSLPNCTIMIAALRTPVIDSVVSCGVVNAYSLRPGLSPS